MAIELDEKVNPNTRNYCAFLRDLDDLLEKRPGGFVAYHDGQQLDAGDQEEDVYRVARSKVPKGLVSVGAKEVHAVEAFAIEDVELLPELGEQAMNPPFAPCGGVGFPRGETMWGLPGSWSGSAASPA